MPLRPCNECSSTRGAPSKEGAPALSSFGHDARGSVAIEFAFVAAVFLAILFGIMTYGFQFATRIALSYAVAEGGRAAVAGLDPTQRQAEAEERIGQVLEAYRPLVDPDSAPRTYVEEQTEFGLALRITIDYTDTRFTRLPFIPAPDGTMRVTTTYIVSDPS